MSLFIFLIVLSILIVVHEFGHFIVAKKSGVKVERFSLGFGPRLFSRKKGDTEYTICIFPMGGFVKLAGDNPDECKGGKDEYLSQPPGKRFNIVVAGATLNYVLGFLCFVLIFCTGYPRTTAKIGGLLDGYGAQQAGVHAGDIITSVEGKKVIFWDELQQAVQEKQSADKISVTVQRENKTLNLEIPLKKQEMENVLGDKLKVGLLGVTPSDESRIVKHGILASIGLGAQRTYDLTILTYKALWRMVIRKMSFRESVTGPLGMFYITSKAANSGITALINVLAALSISLALFNLLPFPALDGGYIFLLAIEKIRGKAFSKKFENIFGQIGMGLLITLAVAVLYNDLVRFNIFDKITKLFIK